MQLVVSKLLLRVLAKGLPKNNLVASDDYELL
jgi:hypothetical protein